MKRPTFSAFTAIAVVCLSLISSGCATSTRLERSWAAPEVGSIQFEKILVMAIAPDDALRRSAEDAMLREIERAEAVASYQFVPRLEDLRDRSRVAAAVSEAGADGLVVMRVVSDETEVSYVPGRPMPPPYTSFWGYYTRPYALRPLYWESWTEPVNERVIGIETNIYDSANEWLVWSGFTRTRDPRDVGQLVAEVAKVVRSRLREQGLIQ